MEITVRGVDDLERVGARLVAAGRGGLLDAVGDGMHDGVQALPERVSANAGRVLPQRGGLARLASGARTTVTRTHDGIRVVVAGSVNVELVDRGRVVHPVYGNRSVSVAQSVPSRAFSDPIEQEVPRIREGAEQAVRDLARHIES